MTESLQMKNFKLLAQPEYDKVWDKFYHLFHFRPSINQFPAITTDKPLLKFDIAKCFSETFPSQKLEEFAIKLFTSITNSDERLYALDWHHACYEFDPRKEMDRDQFGEWVIPILPNGDYYIFVTKDFKNVWFGHPWEQTISLIGEKMISHVSAEEFNSILEL